MSEGIVYILTNEAMPDLVKIGKTGLPIEKRMKDLYTAGIPIPFECFHASKVQDVNFVEEQLHAAFDESRVNQNREFFKIPRECVRSALLLAEVEDVTPSKVDEDSEDQIALNRARAWRSPFTFSMADIPIGATLEFGKDAKITCTVTSEKTVSFENQETSAYFGERSHLFRFQSGHPSERSDAGCFRMG